MGWILKLLAGQGGVWILAGALLAASAAGAGGGYLARGLVDAPALAAAKLEAEQNHGKALTCERDREHDLAVGNAKVVGELQNQVHQLQGILDDLERQRHERENETSKYLAALERLPKTSVCAGSLPERAYRDSVQPHRAAVP